MNNILKYRLLGWLSYSLIIYMINFQYQVWMVGVSPKLWFIGIPYSILLGFIFTIITEILILLRRLDDNPNYKHKKLVNNTKYPKMPFKCPYGDFSCKYIGTTNTPYKDCNNCPDKPKKRNKI